ncbi:MAG TPA: hypothetical protein VK212_00470 [Lentimicrobium sp.]|nr:hypothetical protein [Lentimicrobium sp.]
MKKINLLVILSFLLITGGLLSSCQKEDSIKQDQKSSGELKQVNIDCEECVATWAETLVTYDASYFVPQGPNVSNPTNIYLDVYNDETTIYYRVYRLNGETFKHLSINGTVVLTYTDPAVTEYLWNAPLSSEWAACDVVTTNLIVGGLNIHNAHFNACINYELRDICVCDQTETAWACGTRYTQKGNWATYTTYVANSTVQILAGQTIDVGTVHLSAVVNGMVTMTFNLTNGWRFQNVSESLKIQGYSTPPSGNPAPGQFANKFDATGTTWQVTIPAANYYGIHLDVQLCE